MALEKDPLGRNAVCYYSSTLLTASDQGTIDTWISTIASKGGDVYDEADNLAPEYADITTRKKAAGGFEARKPVLRTGEVTFDVSWEVNNVSDTFVQTLIDAARDLTPLGFGFMDYAHDDPDMGSGDIIQGVAGNFYVSFTKAAAIRDAQRASMTVTAESFVVWHKSAPS